MHCFPVLPISHDIDFLKDAFAFTEGESQQTASVQCCRMRIAHLDEASIELDDLYPIS